MKKILNWISYLWLGVLVILIALLIISKMNRTEYILNFVPMKVLSGSMEPRIKVGDIVIAKKVDPLTIKEGDVITYKMNNNTNVTHRVVEVIRNGYDPYFITKGDANNIEDSEQVSGENLVGKLIFTIPKLGYFINFAARPFGFIALFIIPGIILLSKEALSYVKSS